MHRHLKSHQTQFACTFPGCTETFRKKSQLRAHMSAVHTGDPNKPYKCTQCSRCFAFPGQLALHERMHATVDHVCGYDNCGYVAHSLDELRKHVQDVHSVVKPSDLPSQSPSPEPSSQAESGGDSQSPTVEKAQKHAENRVKCSVCGKMLHPKSLAKHMTTHSSDAPMFACTVPGCMKVYYSKQSLRAHFNASHSDHRFKCPHCSATFAYKNSMQQHITRVHTGDIEVSSASCSPQPETAAAAAAAAATASSSPSFDLGNRAAKEEANSSTTHGIMRSRSTDVLLPQPQKRLCRIAGLDPETVLFGGDPATLAPPPPITLQVQPMQNQEQLQTAPVVPPLQQ